MCNAHSQTHATIAERKGPRDLKMLQPMIGDFQKYQASAESCREGEFADFSDMATPSQKR